MSITSGTGQAADIIGTAQSVARSAEGVPAFREMLEALPAAIYTTDGDGRLTWFNPACVAFSGRTPELGGSHWCVTWKLYYPDGTPMRHEDCPMAVALKEGRTVRGKQAIAERPDGSRVWFEAHPAPLYDAGGAVVGGINLLIDISERKRIEAALRKNERELADFFENAAMPVHWVGPDGRILRANRAELDMLGYSSDEYVGHHISEFHADAEAIGEILRKLQSGETVVRHEATLRCKDGSVRHVLIDSNVLWEDGEFIHTRCFTQDITEPRQAEEQLRRYADELAQFNRVAVGRELRMIELKKEINRLLCRLGEAPRYPLQFEADTEAMDA